MGMGGKKYRDVINDVVNKDIEVNTNRNTTCIKLARLCSTVNIAENIIIPKIGNLK